MCYSASWDNIMFVMENYFRLMQHWKRVMPKEIFELRYSDLLEDFDNTAKKLMGYCGLNTGEDIRDFHKLEREVSTASKFQVREPIYKTSSGKWRNYEPYYGKYFAEITVLAMKYNYGW
jgi:hypothetical protein